LRGHRKATVVSLSKLLKIITCQFLIVAYEKYLWWMLHSRGLDHLLLDLWLLVEHVDDRLLLDPGGEDGLGDGGRGGLEDDDAVVFLGRSRGDRFVGYGLVLRGQPHEDRLVGLAVTLVGLAGGRELDGVVEGGAGGVIAVLDGVAGLALRDRAADGGDGRPAGPLYRAEPGPGREGGDRDGGDRQQQEEVVHFRCVKKYTYK